MRATIDSDYQNIIEVRLSQRLEDRFERNYFFFQRQKGKRKVWGLQHMVCADRYCTPDFEIAPDYPYEEGKPAMQNREKWVIERAEVQDDVWYSVVDLRAKKQGVVVTFCHATQESVFTGSAQAIVDFLNVYKKNLAVVGASDR